MPTFINFRDAVSKQLSKMEEKGLLQTSAAKDQLWDTYLNSFPEGTNLMYKERTEYDCNCCKQFIRNIGGTVALVDGKLETPWNVEVGGYFQVVADALNDLVLNSLVDTIYLNESSKVGQKDNLAHLESGELKKYDHFYHILDSKHVRNKYDITTIKGQYRTSFQTLKRTVQDISPDAVDIVLELIAQNSLYRGSEFKTGVSNLKKFLKQYNDSGNNDFLIWEKVLASGSHGIALRNSVIGTLLEHLSEGKDLEYAVKSFEEKVAPHNYKRTSALITKGMIDQANKKVTELGLQDDLERRPAKDTDLTINNVLFADKSSKIIGNVFDELKGSVKAKTPSMDKMEEVTVETFINSILPKADKIEVLFENKHAGNLMNLVAPVNDTGNNLFKWDNNFSWSYNGDVTDSIKEKVKAAGGDVTGVLRCSLGWYNSDDLDIHLKEPCGNHIYYSSKHNRRTTGKLDVDMNAGCKNDSVSPVENITYSNKSCIQEGYYSLQVNNYTKRNHNPDQQGFVVEVEFDGIVSTFTYDKTVRDKETITAVHFKYTKANGIEFVEENCLPSTSATKEVWGINTNNLHEVNMIMKSPNHWDDQKVGNEHLFFMIKGCKNEENVRGFYNEYLRNELTEHRKVFEILGSKMKAAPTEDQLAGLGFSSTVRNELVCKVSGSFNRFVKVKF